MKKCSPPHKLALFTVITGTLVNTSFCAVSVILNDDMTNPDYFESSLNNASNSSNPDDFSSGYISSTAGDQIIIAHRHEVDNFAASGASFVQTIFREQNTQYEPSTQGTINTISFSIDLMFEPGRPSGNLFDDVFFFVRDSTGNEGRVGGFTDISFISDNNWHTITATGLTDSSFPNFPNLNNPGLRQFGFGFTSDIELANIGPDGYETFEFEVVADNFIVTIDTVPEPSQATLLALAGILSIVKRKR